MAWVEPQYCNTDHALIPINGPELKGIKSILNIDLVVAVSLEVSSELQHCNIFFEHEQHCILGYLKKTNMCIEQGCKHKMRTLFTPAQDDLRLTFFFLLLCVSTVVAAVVVK